MEQKPDPEQMLDQIVCPAFIVENGIITQANISAIQRQITAGLEVLPLLISGQQEYREFTSGRLCLTLAVQGLTYQASVVRNNTSEIFYLESQYINPELRAFAVASQGLREPLSNALIHADMLKDGCESLLSHDCKKQLLQLVRNLHQIHRAVCNMSDASSSNKGLMSNIENRDLSATVNEIIEKAQALTAKAGMTLEYTPLNKSVYCLINHDMLERAILNMISNAFKYSTEGTAVRACLERGKGKVSFSITNQINPMEQAIGTNLFQNYLWEPNIQNANAGIGLGITIARNAATAHGGTLLLDQPEADTVRFTLTIPVAKHSSTPLRSPVILPVDYSGGYDHALTELSDILPSEFFE